MRYAGRRVRERLAEQWYKEFSGALCDYHSTWNIHCLYNPVCILDTLDLIIRIGLSSLVHFVKGTKSDFENSITKALVSPATQVLRIDSGRTPKIPSPAKPQVQRRGLGLLQED